jgi:hypothetical protein
VVVEIRLHYFIVNERDEHFPEIDPLGRRTVFSVFNFPCDWNEYDETHNGRDPEHHHPAGDAHVEYSEEFVAEVLLVDFSDKAGGNGVVGEMMHDDIKHRFVFAAA